MTDKSECFYGLTARVSCGGWESRHPVETEKLEATKTACLHPVRAVSLTGRNGLAAHSPDAFSGGTGENTARTHLSTARIVRRRHFDTASSFLRLPLPDTLIITVELDQVPFGIEEVKHPTVQPTRCI